MFDRHVALGFTVSCSRIVVEISVGFTATCGLCDVGEYGPLVWRQTLPPIANPMKPLSLVSSWVWKENLRILGITHSPQSPDPPHLVKHRALGKCSQDTHWTPRVDAPVIPWKIQCGSTGIVKPSPSWVTPQEMLDVSPSGGWSQVVCHPSLSPIGSLQGHFSSLQP